jgi:hypothetical protein
MTDEEKRRKLAEWRAAEAARAAEARTGASLPDAEAPRMGAFSEDEPEKHQRTRTRRKPSR